MGRTPLYLALKKQHKQAICLLLDYGARETDEVLANAIHLSNVCITEVLLSRGLLNIRKHGLIDDVSKLLNRSSHLMFSLLNQVPPSHWKNRPRTPLHITALRNRSDLIDQLIDYGIDINQRSTECSPYCVIYIY